MNFLEFLQLKEENQLGTYVCANVAKKDAKVIIDTLAKHGITNLVHPDELHVTVIYSKTPCPVAYNLSKLKDFNASFGTDRFDIFGKDEKVLVIRGWSSSLERINASLMKNGATSDFPEYNPHITVAVNTDVDEVTVSAMSFIIRELDEKLKNGISLDSLTIKPITGNPYAIKMNDGSVLQR